MKWSLIAAVNNESILHSCLLSSPEVGTAQDVILQRGHSSAATAYNAGIEQARADVLVFAHQDVYLPEGWVASVQRAVDTLSREDPMWGVLGAWGVPEGGHRSGYLYCAGLRETLGGPFKGARQVRTLDEVVLIMRRASGLRFDERLAGFHMYGSDLCLEAARYGMKSYAISAFCIHNTNGYNLLPLAFWRNYFFMRRKWKSQLPIETTCTEITCFCYPVIRWNLAQIFKIALKRHKPGRRVPDPCLLAQQVGGPYARKNAT